MRTEGEGIPALISVHDVMPPTLPQVRELLRRLCSRSLAPITLLIIPGRHWTHEQIDELRAFQDRSMVLAGHGWSHRIDGIRGLKHRLHSAFISQDAGEHLSLDRHQIRDLVRRCFDWFEAHKLGAPDLYVPPAWAMGPLSRGELQRLPFRRYETLGGVYDSATDRYTRLPLVGFEARSAWRAPPLRLWNSLNLSAARALAPVRIGIHPGDLDLPLARDLMALLDRPLHCRGYQELP
jgi:predicted deacetylase